jgi:predicted 2-oxoglutarate/Fe(II)-dependent dioxygenase YbiX|tara:strand:+ start:557 stop:1123 length:567 start_codon:yes stop_codon:yes gene_type:complete
MMSSTLEQYIRVYDNIITADVCARTVASLSCDHSWEDHNFNNTSTRTVATGEDDLQMNWSNIEQKQLIQNKIYSAIETYIIKDLACEWFAGWQGYSPLRFNRYNEQNKMKLHCDHIQDLFGPGTNGIPILSIVGALNNDYEGGEFVMWDTVIDIPPGAVLIFPSNFMYPHRVNPVTLGTRYSYVSWVY